MRSGVNCIIYYSAIFNCLRMSVGATSSIYLLSRGITLVELGVLKSLQSIIFFALDIPTSYLSDKYSRKYAFIIASLFGGFWLIVTGISKSIEWFLFAEILNSISLTIIGGVVYSYIIDNSGESSNSIPLLNRVNKIQFLLMAISSIIGAIVYHFEPMLIWLISGGLCIALSILGLWVLPEPIIKKSSVKISFISSLKGSVFMGRDLLLEGVNLSILLVIFQVLLQYWQVMVVDSFDFNNSIFYGAVFSLILLSQSISGHVSSFFEGKRGNTTISFILISCFLLLFLSFYLNLKYVFLSTLIVSFGVIQSNLAIARGSYHKLTTPHSRSIQESIVTTFSKLLSIIILPLVAFISEKTQWWGALLFLAVLCILNVIITSRRVLE
ncbi:MFS transporter [Rosenbergiella nectarea]|uniref:MFS transporter n=1 Tax=Rosenbergiella nectarea TaxID=988801 RepID=UPI001BD92A22|nr:MFS transporter [Rosenbergiella nectarea]MBT0731656.1 MFS transporter [Rosenbergiella nectarea subsp. apis]